MTYRKDRKHGNDAEIKEKPNRTSSQATTGAIPILSLPSLRKLKYETVVPIVKPMMINLHYL